MNIQMSDWDETPLLRAGSNVADTATQRSDEIPCSFAGWTTRYNVGNIHEIKQILSTPAQD